MTATNPAAVVAAGAYTPGKNRNTTMTPDRMILASLPIPPQDRQMLRIAAGMEDVRAMRPLPPRSGGVATYISITEGG